jgi:hypothetical protein
MTSWAWAYEGACLLQHIGIGDHDLEATGIIVVGEFVFASDAVL